MQSIKINLIYRDKNVKIHYSIISCFFESIGAKTSSFFVKPVRTTIILQGLSHIGEESSEIKAIYFNRS